MSQQQDDTFVRTFIVVLVALVIFTVAVFTLAQIIAGDAASTALEPKIVGDRTKPVGTVNTVSPAPAVAKSAEEIYKSVCAACHDSGAAGAPKLGDNATWAPRLAKGQETLVKSALNGINAMPPKGGNPSLSDDDIKKTVEYMLTKVKVETTPATPAQPATPAPAAQPPATPPAQPAESAPPAPAEQSQAAPAQTATTTQAEVEGLMQSKGYLCLGCHQVNTRAVGPSYKEIAVKYKGDANALMALSQKIKQGGGGVWGPMPMPPNATVTDEDLKTIVNWILALN